MINEKIREMILHPTLRAVITSHYLYELDGIGGYKLPIEVVEYLGATTSAIFFDIVDHIYSYTDSNIDDMEGKIAEIDIIQQYVYTPMNNIGVHLSVEELTKRHKISKHTLSMILKELETLNLIHIFYKSMPKKRYFSVKFGIGDGMEIQTIEHEMEERGL